MEPNRNIERAQEIALSNAGPLPETEDWTEMMPDVEEELTYENIGITVPEFTAPKPVFCITYTWWSWHPRYAYWSKSCWKGATIEDAYESIGRAGASKMRYYHNKLIMSDGHVLTEVADEPCKELDTWKKIIYGDDELLKSSFMTGIVQ